MYEQIYNLTSMFFILKTSFSVMQILLTVRLLASGETDGAITSLEITGHFF